MSKKFKVAIQTGNVTVQSKSAGEVAVWYVDRRNRRVSVVIPSFGTRELAPKLTDPALLRHSNVEDLVRQGRLMVL